MSRPGKRNALHPDMIQELYSAFLDFERSDDIRVVVLQGQGNTFCAGADLEYLQELQSYTYEENLEDSTNLKNLFSKIHSFPKPVIAKIQGHAIAGGCGLATVCDFSFSVPDAKFGYTEVRIGFLPALVLVFLLRKVGEGVAKSLLLSGNLISASDASQAKLINEVVDPERIDEYVSDFAKDLASGTSSNSIHLTKQMINEVQDMSLQEGLEYAAKMNARARESEDCKKGIAAFLDKKRIKW